MKCPNTITGMLSALRKKYPEKYITIQKEWRAHHHLDDVIIDYSLYIADIYSGVTCTWDELQQAVVTLLKETP